MGGFASEIAKYCTDKKLKRRRKLNRSAVQESNIGSWSSCIAVGQSHLNLKCAASPLSDLRPPFLLRLGWDEGQGRMVLAARCWLEVRWEGQRVEGR